MASNSRGTVFLGFKSQAIITALWQSMNHGGLLGIPEILFADECLSFKCGGHAEVTVWCSGPPPRICKAKICLKLYHAKAYCVISFFICKMGITKQWSPITYTFNIWESTQCTQRKKKHPTENDPAIVIYTYTHEMILYKSP